jgi:hypothetical protein
MTATPTPAEVLQWEDEVLRPAMFGLEDWELVERINDVYSRLHSRLAGRDARAPLDADTESLFTELKNFVAEVPEKRSNVGGGAHA